MIVARLLTPETMVNVSGPPAFVIVIPPYEAAAIAARPADADALIVKASPTLPWKSASSVELSDKTQGITSSEALPRTGMLMCAALG